MIWNNRHLKMFQKKRKRQAEHGSKEYDKNLFKAVAKETVAVETVSIKS